MRWPFNPNLDRTTCGAAKSREPHHDRTEKRRIWNGNATNAGKSIDRIRAVMHQFQEEPGSRKSIAQSRKLWTALRALDGYLAGQSDWLVNYAERHRAGLRVGTAITEATANFLVNAG